MIKMDNAAAKTYWSITRPAGITLLAVALAVALRVWPLFSLEERIPWVTFYPAVMAAALFGGISAGLMSTAASCLIVIYLWDWFSPLPFIQAPADWLGLGVFFFNCVFISAIAESSRRARRHARLSQEQAETASRAKSIFLANMSHELRTPLNAVMGFSRLVRNDQGLNSMQVSRLDIIIQSGEHLLNLINNILDISKIESGMAYLEESPTALHTVIQDVYNLMTVQAAAKGLDLTLDLEISLPVYVSMDAAKFRQVLINLLGNAIKFTSSGGVALRASHANKSDSPTPWMRVEVQDSGPGIRREDRQAVFRPFVQAGGVSAHENGTGLGLTISRQNIEMMGGQIGIADASEKGALV